MKLAHVRANSSSSKLIHLAGERACWSRRTRYDQVFGRWPRPAPVSLPHTSPFDSVCHPSFRDASYFETQLSPILDAEAEAFVKVTLTDSLSNVFLCAFFFTLMQLMWRMLVFETLRQQL